MHSIVEHNIASYPFSQVEEDIINEYYMPKKNWDNKKLSELKSRIRLFLRYVQSNQCCYCKQPLGFDNRQSDIEHIIDKNGQPLLAFVSKNLALSCPACNSAKTNQGVLYTENGEDLVDIPSNSEAYKIVHPYFDHYSEHITITGSVYLANTAKGSTTIEYCKLNRLLDIEEKKKDYYMRQKFINSLINSNLPEEKVAKNIKRILDWNYGEIKD